AIETGKPLSRNAFGRATSTFAFAPGRHGDAGRQMDSGRSLLATRSAIRGCAGLEEPRSSGADGGRLEVRPQLRPVPHQPEQEEAQHQTGPEPIDRHSVPRLMGVRPRGRNGGRIARQAGVVKLSESAARNYPPSIEGGPFRNCRGKRMFSSRVLEHQKAMYQ